MRLGYKWLRKGVVSKTWNGTFDLDERFAERLLRRVSNQRMEIEDRRDEKFGRINEFPGLLRNSRRSRAKTEADRKYYRISAFFYCAHRNKEQKASILSFRSMSRRRKQFSSMKAAARIPRFSLARSLRKKSECM